MRTKNLRRVLAVILILTMAAGLWTGASAADSRVQASAEKAAAYLVEAIPAAQPGQSGGEWLIIGLARSGLGADSAYYAAYAETLKAWVQECGGVLDTRRYTAVSYTHLPICLYFPLTFYSAFF